MSTFKGPARKVGSAKGTRTPEAVDDEPHNHEVVRARSASDATPVAIMVPGGLLQKTDSQHNHTSWLLMFVASVPISLLLRRSVY